METFGERLSMLRRGAGMSRESLAGLLGISETALCGYETNYSQPTERVLARAAQIFNVSEAYIALLTDDPSVSEDMSVREIYVAKCVRGGSGMVMREDIVDTAFIPRDDSRGREYYGLIMKDDSLLRARIGKGDLLIVRRQNHASNGDIVVALRGEEEAVVRRYCRKWNIVTLSPESASPQYEPIFIDVNEEHFMISGKVVEVRIRDL